MPRTPRVPRNARRLRTYEELGSYLSDFALGREPFLWLFGRPGLSKSESIRTATKGRQVLHHRAGNLTPLYFFMACYQHRGQPIILDDAEHLLDSKVGAKLVSALGESTPAKQMCYGTTSDILARSGVPQAYYTDSPLLVIANRVTAHEAIMSRAKVLHFAPANLEIHQEVARWFWDQQIHDWMGQHLSRLRPIDVRWYVQAASDKRNRRDWRRIILDAYSLDPTSALVIELEGNRRYPLVRDKVGEFLARRAIVNDTYEAAERAYHRTKRRLEEAGELPAPAVLIYLLSRNTPPEDLSRERLDAMTERANSPQQEVVEDRPPDLPRPVVAPVVPREVFAQPITGDTASTHGHLTDDTLPWEPPEDSDGD